MNYIITPTGPGASFINYNMRKCCKIRNIRSEEILSNVVFSQISLPLKSTEDIIWKHHCQYISPKC